MGGGVWGGIAALDLVFLCLYAPCPCAPSTLCHPCPCDPLPLYPPSPLPHALLSLSLSCLEKPALTLDVLEVFREGVLPQASALHCGNAEWTQHATLSGWILVIWRTTWALSSRCTATPRSCRSCQWQ